jgi:hypothetical protein
MGMGIDPGSSAAEYEQILDTSGTFTKLYCSVMNPPSGGSMVFTFEYTTSPGGTLTAGPTCSIAVGATTGATHGGLSVTLAAGDLVVVKMTGSMGEGVETFSAGP